jgi:hypothetical protein
MIGKNVADNEPYPRLAFVVVEHLVSRFFLLLQQGVMVRSRTGCSVEAFLREEIKATSETIEKIQSIMLDGKPVDDIGQAVVHNGSTLALSAAMPGLVGATLRRGGKYSSFRGTITYRESGQACQPGEGWVRIKIFNLLMAELGIGLLRNGVLLNTSDFLGFMAEQVQDLRQGCSITLNGRSIDAGMLGSDNELRRADKILFSVSSVPASV